MADLLKLTPGELFFVVEGIRYRRAREVDLMAIQTVALLRALGDKKITVEKFLGRSPMDTGKKNADVDHLLAKKKSVEARLKRLGLLGEK